MSDPGSVTSWLVRADSVNRDDAASLLWNRFAFRLVRVARRHLRNTDQRMYDEEDLALSTLQEFLYRQERGQFTRLSSRQDLWRLLVTISLNKSRNHRRFLGQLCRSPRGSGGLASTFQEERFLDGELVGGRVGSREMEDSESPDWIVMMADQCRYLMGLLDNQDSSGKLRQIAAMRLIAGGNASSLHRAIRELHHKKWVEEDFSRRQRVLLRHVINVCNTIGYAHDRGVCHRDLTPSNILIGPFGETFVVDWGLAKVFREGMKGSGSPSDVEDSTAMGSQQNVLDLGLSGATRESVGSKSSVAGTPGYRAPESLGNEMIMDWPMVDVYSIGAILHCIIYGKSPSKSQDVRASALQDDSFFLRLVMQRGKTLVVSSKLLAISEKAMHCNLKQRYKSTLALANDLENYLSGEPISAKGEGIVERGVRWIGKHRHWALAGLAAAITLAGAAVTVVVLQSQHNRELQMAANTLQRAFESEELHRVQEGRLRELAERNERAARDREGLAIEALRSYCEAIYRNDVLKNSASLIGLRQQLLEDPIAFFEEISKGNTDVNDTSFSYLERLAQTAEELAKLSFVYGDYAQCERWVARSIERYEDLERKLREDDLASGKSSEVRTGDLLRNTVGHSDSYRLQGMIRILRGDRVGAKESLQTSSAWQMIRDEVQQRFFGSTIFETYRSKQFLEQLEAEERSEWESLWNMLRVVD